MFGYYAYRLESLNKKITDNWISRFEIWPYLEEFAEDSHTELLAEFGNRPDLIIGNYSDGNLVATLLSKKFNITQCNVAHALEKSKYLYSALYWNELEDQYHFSTQFYCRSGCNELCRFYNFFDLPGNCRKRRQHWTV